MACFFCNHRAPKCTGNCIFSSTFLTADVYPIFRRLNDTIGHELFRSMLEMARELGNQLNRPEFPLEWARLQYNLLGYNDKDIIKLDQNISELRVDVGDLRHGFITFSQEQNVRSLGIQQKFSDFSGMMSKMQNILTSRSSLTPSNGGVPNNSSPLNAAQIPDLKKVSEAHLDLNRHTWKLFSDMSRKLAAMELTVQICSLNMSELNRRLCVVEANGAAPQGDAGATPQGDAGAGAGAGAAPQGLGDGASD